ncbi:ankyrin [Orientia tsutsugamushi]|uniref:Ankyrin n=1 Tax=Orientia tsutsugamushi TaxID=784 RepID=A0A2U3R9X9_ORITS|nr:ankyrin [Orientia tsutsugamushi]
MISKSKTKYALHIAIKDCNIEKVQQLINKDSNARLG